MPTGLMPHALRAHGIQYLNRLQKGIEKHRNISEIPRAQRRLAAPLDKIIASNRESQSGDSEAVITLTYGVSDPLDLIIGAPYARVPEGHTEKGIGDVSLGGKWRIYSHNANSIALKPQLGLATGNERRCRGSGATTYSMTILTTPRT